MELPTYRYQRNLRMDESRLGEKAGALAMFRRSVESGFCYPYLAFDPLLSSLREENDFPPILELARQRHEVFQTRLLPGARGNNILGSGRFFGL